MTIYEAMTTRRTIRRFAQKPISDEILEKAVNVARLAPVGGNAQSLKFCVVKTPELVSAVFDETKWGMHLKNGSGRPKPGELRLPGFSSATTPPSRSSHDSRHRGSR